MFPDKVWVTFSDKDKMQKIICRPFGLAFTIPTGPKEKLTVRKANMLKK